MKIVLCIKQVPDTSDIKWTENNTINREGVESVINPVDLYAIETALRLKDKNNADISAVSMGPLQAKDVIKYAISMGCDRGYLLSDKKFAGSDTYATAKTLAHFVKSHVPDFDLIICGQFAADGDTAQTGPSLAKQLDIPVVTYVKEVKEDNKNLVIKRESEQYLETYNAEPPLLICVSKGEHEPRRPKINGFIKSKNTEIKVLSCDDIGLSPENTGIKGSPTYVSKAFTPEISHNGEMYFCDDIKKSANILKQKIREYSND